MSSYLLTYFFAGWAFSRPAAVWVAVVAGVALVAVVAVVVAGALFWDLLSLFI
jgi:hypothetical protein